MMKNLFPVIFATVLLSFGPSLAAADIACFDWDCTNGYTCTFDASCSSGSPFIWKYSWTWGDGTSTGLTGNSTPSHTYSGSTYAYPTVTLKIYPWSNNTESVTCQIVAQNVFSPPLSETGRCTSAP